MAKSISGMDLLGKFDAAGILPDKVKRVIIDVPFDGPVEMYFQTVATDKLADVDLPELLKANFQIVGGEPATARCDDPNTYPRRSDDPNIVELAPVDGWKRWAKLEDLSDEDRSKLASHNL